MGFKLVDMAETPKEEAREAQTVILAGTSIGDNKPRYPYGLEVTLNEESLTKLGLRENPPEVGEVLHVMALMKVTSYSENENEGGSNCCVRAQIIQMGLENESKEYSYKDTLYDKNKEEYGDD